MTDNVIPFPSPEYPEPPKMYCAECGEERTNPTAAADPGPCSCGATWRVSHKSMVRSTGPTVTEQ